MMNYKFARNKKFSTLLLSATAIMFLGTMIATVASAGLLSGVYSAALLIAICYIVYKSYSVLMIEDGYLASGIIYTKIIRLEDITGVTMFGNTMIITAKKKSSVQKMKINLPILSGNEQMCSEFFAELKNSLPKTASVDEKSERILSGEVQKEDVRVNYAGLPFGGGVLVLAAVIAFYFFRDLMSFADRIGAITDISYPVSAWISWSQAAITAIIAIFALVLLVLILRKSKRAVAAIRLYFIAYIGYVTIVEILTLVSSAELTVYDIGYFIAQIALAALIMLTVRMYLDISLRVKNTFAESTDDDTVEQ